MILQCLYHFFCMNIFIIVIYVWERLQLLFSLLIILCDVMFEQSFDHFVRVQRRNTAGLQESKYTVCYLIKLLCVCLYCLCWWIINELTAWVQEIHLFLQYFWIDCYLITIFTFNLKTTQFTFTQCDIYIYFSFKIEQSFLMMCSKKVNVITFS